MLPLLQMLGKRDCEDEVVWQWNELVQLAMERVYVCIHIFMYNTKKFPVYLINRQLYFSKGKIGVGWGEVD